MDYFNHTTGDEKGKHLSSEDDAQLLLYMENPWIFTTKCCLNCCNLHFA